MQGTNNGNQIKFTQDQLEHIEYLKKHLPMTYRIDTEKPSAGKTIQAYEMMKAFQMMKK
jgi:hypothetical protein